MIRIGLEKVLPKNLTIRYIVALAAVGILAILGQVVIQTSLARQSADQRRVRILDSQLRDSENLRKFVILLHSTIQKGQKKNLSDMMQAFAIQFQKNQKLLNAHGITATDEVRLYPEITIPYQKLESSLSGIVDVCNALGRTTDFDIVQRLNSAYPELMRLESNYSAGLISLSKYYNQRLEKQIVDAKKLELFLLFTTLLVLVIEGLFVFLPGVQSLYDALRIRSDFLGRMGHEMRNPMNSILGMAHLLFETPLTDQQKKYLSILQKSSVGLLEVLNNLLDFSSLESGKLKMERISFDFYKLLERIIDLSVYGAHANGIELVLDLDTSVPLKLVGDPARLQQILTNLLGNAVKFTKQGEVVLKVQLQEKIEGQAWVQFSVIDTGIGINKRQMSRIFDAFVQEDSTVRRRFGGTGLGLSISKDLVSLLGGSLAVDSKKNLGSRFYFTVPFQVTEECTVEKTIKELNFGNILKQIYSQEYIQVPATNFVPNLEQNIEQSLDKYDALVIEPNDSVSLTLTNLILKTGGHPSRVRTLQELSATLSLMNASKINKKIILIDHEFSKEVLSDIFSSVRKGTIKPDPFIFLIKTTASTGEIEKLAEYGFRNFLFKPIKPLQLLESIVHLLSGELIDGIAIPKSELNTQVHGGDIVQHLKQDQRPLRVLAADDSKDNQYIIKAYLTSLPYRVSFADNGRIALEKFKAGQFDVVLMDLQMPEMDGYTATQLIRAWESAENLRPTPIIAVSAHDHEAGSDRFQNAKFSAYLVKPISPNQLRSAILNYTQELPLPGLKTYGSSSVEQNMSTPQNDDFKYLEDELASLVPQYLENRRQELKELRSFLEKTNFEKIQTVGHRLKGNAKSYGFDGLGKIGGRLEEAARQQDIPLIKTLIQETENYLNQVGLSS